MGKKTEIKSRIDLLKTAIPGHFRVVVSSIFETNKCFLARRTSEKVDPKTRVRTVLGTDFPDLQEAIDLAIKYRASHQDKILTCEVYNDCGQVVPFNAPEEVAC